MMNVFPSGPLSALGAINLTDGSWVVSDPSNVLDTIDFDGTEHTITTLANSGTVVWTKLISDFCAYNSTDSVRLEGRVDTTGGGWGGSDRVLMGLEDSGGGLWAAGGPRPTGAIGIQTNAVAFGVTTGAGIVHGLIQVQSFLGARIGPLAALAYDASWVYQTYRAYDVGIAASVDTVRVMLTRTTAGVTTFTVGVSAKVTRYSNTLITKI